ncbi:MAG: hypothetical protein ACI8RD_002386 [Bacillariaceae sp.]|jgi:hypothetical protein
MSLLSFFTKILWKDYLLDVTTGKLKILANSKIPTKEIHKAKI